jgi:ADP-ribose pyrophosphatase YjhB (NUDIX family)
MNDTRFTLRSAVYLILIKDGKILLSKRQNTGWEDGNYTLVSGHLDGGEKVTTAMAREAKEEAGITILPEDLEIMVVMHRKANYEYVDFFLTAEKWEGEIQNMEPHICEELKWFPLTNLPNNMVSSMRQGLENFQKGIFFSESGF